jgi:oxalate decarboxylase/phosphoglucose isomerase-like protein (cupin superfamily)
LRVPLVFDDGSFSEDATFLVSGMFLRSPKEVLSKDLHTPVSAFDNLPSNQLYIFDGSAPPADISDPAVNITSPAGSLPINKSYTYHLSQQMPYIVPGGSIKLIDTTNFPISSDISAALVSIEP